MTVNMFAKSSLDMWKNTNIYDLIQNKIIWNGALGSIPSEYLALQMLAFDTLIENDKPTIEIYVKIKKEN